jgi:DNA-binding NarL/FixJ family response regulator
MDSQDVRIALIHTNQLFLECLSCSLAQADSITVVHSASALEQTEEQLTLYKPDILVLGFDLFHGHDFDNFVGMRALTSTIKTLIIDVPETERDVFYCIEKVGAHGYLKRDASIKDLLAHINALMQGETFCSPRIASLMFCRMSTLARRIEEQSAVNAGCLTRREAEIVGLIENGLSNKEIALRLDVEVSTVKNHVHNILEKVQLHDRRSAVQCLKRQRFIATRV